MKYTSFQELPVWRDAVRLAVDVFQLTLHPEFRGKGDLANQMQRAALSVSNNIAEGFERQSSRELLQFIYIAKGSSGECVSMCAVAKALGFLADRRPAVESIEVLCHGVSRQLGAWAASLRNGNIEGSRYLNSRDRERRDADERRHEFMETLKRQHAGRLEELARTRMGGNGE